MSNLPPIEQLLPHDAPMILIDQAVSISEDAIHCRVTIDRQHLFFKPELGGVPAYVGIEFMAQAIAAWSGFHAGQRGATPPIGFLLGSRRYQVDVSTFAEQWVLDIYAQQVMEDNGMAVFSGKIVQQDQVLATCQLNVYVPDEQKLTEMRSRAHS